MLNDSYHYIVRFDAIQALFHQLKKTWKHFFVFVARLFHPTPCRAKRPNMGCISSKQTAKQYKLSKLRRIELSTVISVLLVSCSSLLLFCNLKGVMKWISFKCISAFCALIIKVINSRNKLRHFRLIKQNVWQAILQLVYYHQSCVQEAKRKVKYN